MAQDFPSQAGTEAEGKDASRNSLVQRYTRIITIVLIVVCNGIFLFGMWASGVNLDELVKTQDQFNPQDDVCLRLSWQRLTGATEPIRLCSEWINLSDPTGKPHVLDKNTKVRQGSDGRYYVDRGIKADYRLVGFVGFVAAVMAFGMLTRRYLVNRYRLQLEMAASRSVV
ncbi:MAG: hypothetical protein ABL970_04790 [Nitrospira sp.]